MSRFSGLISRSRETQREVELTPLFVARLLGELAVHRATFSRVWTGCKKSLECILKALMGGVECAAPSMTLSGFDLFPDNSMEFAFEWRRAGGV